MATDSFIRVPPDSTGKKLHTQEHVVGLDTVQVQVMHASDPVEPSYIQRVDSRGAASVRFSEGSPLSDAFGNLKVSETKAIGTYDFVMDASTDLWSIVETGAGAVSYMAAASTMNLEVGTASGDFAGMTTNHHHYYSPGTANLMMMTVALSDTSHAGCERRWGLLDEHNGLYFDLDDAGNLKVAIRSYVTGSLVKSHVLQADWNGDKVDGLGLSGFDLDISKLNIYWIDYQWLGAGRVRFGVVDDYGNRVVCHTILNANHNLYPYMATGSLPLGVQVENKALTGGAASIRLTCASVHTEGCMCYTYWRFIHSFPQKTITGANNYLMAVKSLNTFGGKHNVTTGYPESMALFVASGTVKLDLYWDYFTLGGTPSWTDNSSTIVADTAGTLTLAGQYKPKSWYLEAGAHEINLTHIFEKNDFGIDMNADGTEPIYVVLVASSVSGTPTIVGDLHYAELR